MTIYDELIARLDSHYTRAYESFFRMYRDASDAERNAFESNVRKYLVLLEEIRVETRLKKHYEKEIGLDKWQQKVFVLMLAVLSLIAMWLQEEHLLLALAAVTVYITYEIKQLRIIQSLNLSSDKIRNLERELSLIGPKVSKLEVADWQNSFDLRSKFYENVNFESFGATLDKEIALITIKHAILRRLQLRGTLIANKLVTTDINSDDFEDWVSVVPPSVLSEALEVWKRKEGN